MTFSPGLHLVGLTRFTVDPLSIINRQSRAINIRYVKEVLHKAIHRYRLDLRSKDELRSLIYDTARLSQRLDLFEAFPWQTAIHFAYRYKDFRYRVFYSSLIGDTVISRLKALIEPHSTWCKLVQVNPSQSFFRVCQHELRILDTCKNIYSFRIDDDDALSLDYLDHVVGLYRQGYSKPVLSLAYGYYLSRTDDDLYLLESGYEPKSSVGLGRFTCSERFMSIYDEQYVHTLIPDNRVHYPTDIPCWIRTVHGTNDSGHNISSDSFVSLNASGVIEALGDRFVHVSVPEKLRMMPIISSAKDSPPQIKVLFGHQ